MLKKILLGFLGLVVVAVAGLWLFWPANYAIKGPMLDFLTGRQAPTPDAGTRPPGDTRPHQAPAGGGSLSDDIT